MKLKFRKRDLLIAVIVVCLILLFLFYEMRISLPSTELRCTSCGKPATHRLKAGSWIVGLCDSCYQTAQGLG